MNDSNEQKQDWRAGIAVACERLVHPQVAGDERARQARLIGVLLVAPILAGTLIAQLLTAGFLAAYVMSALCLTFVLAWTGVVAIAQTGRARLVAPVAAAGLCLMLACAMAASGILQSPLLLLVAALPAEAWFIWRERRAVLAGVALSALALLLAAALPGGAIAAEFAGHLWVTPLAYAATVVLRFSAAPRAVPAMISCNELARITGGWVAQVDRQGHVLAASDGSEDLLGVQPVVLFGSGLFERLQVTDRVAYLTGIDALCRGDRGPAIEVRLRMAGPASEYRRCRLSLALAGDDSLFVIAGRIDETGTARAARPARLLRIEEHRAGPPASSGAKDADDDRNMELTEQGHGQTRRFA